MQRLPHVARNSAQGSWTCLWRNELKDSGVQRKCKQCIQLKVSRRYIGLAQATCPRNNEVLLLRWGAMRHTTWHPVLRAYVGQNSMLLEIWRLQATVFKLLHQRLSCWKHGFKINHVHPYAISTSSAPAKSHQTEKSCKLWSETSLSEGTAYQDRFTTWKFQTDNLP
jgi:hypothetical protein